MMARAGTNITLACPGVTPTSYIYLVEWKCVGCGCRKCPNPNGEGLRLMRYNQDRLTRWDGDSLGRRSLDYDRYALRFEPVTSEDSGTYLCLMNNRQTPDSPVVLTVQDVPDAPPSRPLVVRVDSRSVDLSWAPPRRTHHHPVTNYKIFIKEGESSGAWSRTMETADNATAHHVPDLQPFTTYMFRVAAKNALGFSKASRESYPTMTHRERPSGAPEFLADKISTSSTSLSVVWRPPPASTLNGEFLGYEMTYRKVGATDDDGAAAVSDNDIGAGAGTAKKIAINEDMLRIQNYTIGNLQKHTNYVITLAAKNLKGLGPNATIELRTEDGVPLDPRSPRFFNVTSRSIGLTWLPPSNARNLGHDLLGYRIYVAEKRCGADANDNRVAAAAEGARRRRKRPRCRKIAPITINSGKTTKTIVRGLASFTKYHIAIRAFTKKREGPASDSLVVTTDTLPPGAPLITNITCQNANEILLEWHRPKNQIADARNPSPTPIAFYTIRLKVVKTAAAMMTMGGSGADSRSRGGMRTGPRNTEKTVEVMNDTVKNVVFLTNLTADTTYDLSVSAFVASQSLPGQFYEGPSSIPRRVPVGRECDPHQAFSKVPYLFEYNAGIVAGIVSTVVVMILVLLVTLVCRKTKPRYEFLALTPKVLQRQQNGGASTGITVPQATATTQLLNGGAVVGGGHYDCSGNGWFGDPESDIPLSLLPKHVIGLHASDDMAVLKDFEAIHTLRLQQNGSAELHHNGCSNGSSASVFPDILSGRDCANLRSPQYLDGWAMPKSFIVQLGESPFCSSATWKMIWEQQVTIMVTLLTAASKDDLGMLSDAKKFGDFSVALSSEDILPEYTIRTMKLSRWKSSRRAKKGRRGHRDPSASCVGDRYVSQLIFPHWPEVGPPLPAADLLTFVKAAFSCRQAAGGRVFVHSRVGFDSCLLYATLETMLAQIRYHGDVNIANYSRHLSAAHGHTLASADLYVYLHDLLAEAADCGHLHSILVGDAPMNSNGSLSLSMPQ